MGVQEDVNAICQHKEINTFADEHQRREMIDFRKAVTQRIRVEEATNGSRHATSWPVKFVYLTSYLILCTQRIPGNGGRCPAAELGGQYTPEQEILVS